MVIPGTISALGYGKPPWVFQGRAFYQFHLVKAETARAFVPKGSKLIEAFGHTLGGFFLADYDDSPCGSFDELVVLAGLVWNPPTSCAWAARVLVNSDKARVHGKQVFGLPSHVATFTKKQSLKATRKSLFGGFLKKIGMAKEKSTDVIFLDQATTEPRADSRKWLCPVVKLSLPSLSGRTECIPDLLQYSCQIKCRVRVVTPCEVLGPSPSTSTSDTNENKSSETDECWDSEDLKRKLSVSVMLLALELSCLKMKVDAPTVESQYFQPYRSLSIGDGLDNPSLLVLYCTLGPPSFSLGLEGYYNLLSGKYSGGISMLKEELCASLVVRVVAPCEVLGPSASTSTLDTNENKSSETHECWDSEDLKRKLSVLVMLSKPVLALELSCLKMKVDAPTVVS